MLVVDQVGVVSRGRECTEPRGTASTQTIIVNVVGTYGDLTINVSHSLNS